ncbi:WXG100 family type VII secretion target [bacterium]|nr:WXG100 family type VII secretion target [bacterium]
MATLHMDVEQTRVTQQKILETHGNMTQALSDMQGRVNNTVGSAWQGNSAVEFQNEFEQLRSQFTQSLERLNELATRLQSEIAQWEETAARLG